MAARSTRKRETKVRLRGGCLQTEVGKATQNLQKGQGSWGNTPDCIPPVTSSAFSVLTDSGINTKAHKGIRPKPMVPALRPRSLRECILPWGLTDPPQPQPAPWEDPGRPCPVLKCLALKGLQIEGSIQKLLQRHQVSVPVSRGRGSRWVTANIPRGGETVRGGLAWPGR